LRHWGGGIEAKSIVDSTASAGDVHGAVAELRSVPTDLDSADPRVAELRAMLTRFIR
jgi:hypothetical protein